MVCALYMINGNRTELGDFGFSSTVRRCHWAEIKAILVPTDAVALDGVDNVLSAMILAGGKLR